MAQVFISYSRKDLDFVTQLATDLKNAGLDVWYDVSGIAGGARWRSEIENALRNSQFVIVVLSPDSVLSEWVEREFLFSNNLKRKIIPVMYRSCDLPLNYVDLNYIDARGDSYTRNFDELLKALNVDSTTVTLPSSKTLSTKQNFSYLALIGVVILAALFGAIKLFNPGSTPAPTQTMGITPAPEVTSTMVAASATTEVTSESSATPTESIAPSSTPFPTEITDAQGVKMVLVPAGTFMMGSNFPKEGPIHSVYLDSFYIDAFEVTNGQYQKCVDAGICLPPMKTSSNDRPSYYGNPQYVDYPVIFVKWNMAKIYCEWRGDHIHLPTEAQWEKAAHGPEQQMYPWGEGFDCAYGNFSNCKGETVAVGSYRTGRSVYGAYDMAGNVWEWVSDWYEENFYASAGATANNPQGPSGGNTHILRGGSWQSGEANTRTTLRYYGGVDYSAAGVGFRCAKDAIP